MNFKTCTSKPYSFSVIDATLVLENPSPEPEIFAFASVLYIAIGITNLSKVLKI